MKNKYTLQGWLIFLCTLSISVLFFWQARLILEEEQISLQLRNPPIAYGYHSSGPDHCAGGFEDGIVQTGEECDDFTLVNGDGCTTECTVESGWSCSGEPSICDLCGNGTIGGTEGCDDGGTADGDGCSNSCAVESGYTCSGSPSVCQSTCGDGTVDAGEGCDDDNTTSNDGCSSTCTVESGYSCSGTPSTCSTTCGDGTKAGSEGCDDGDTSSGDGCSSTCTVESGFTCSGSAPSTCTGICGDGVIKDNETCDDGNTKSSDGCASNCTVESGFTCSGTPSTCTSQGVGGSGGGGGGGGTSLPKKPAGPPPLCGNGLLNTDNCEECDYSAIDNPVEKGRCSQDCKWLYCGDGIISTDNTHGSIREECEAVRLEEERYTDSSSVVRSRYWFVTPSCGKSCTPPGNTHFLFGKWECRIQWLAPCTGDVTYERFEVRAPFTCGDNREEEQQTVVQRPPPPAHCGNRVVEKEKGEECDRGPANGTSDCSRWCEIFYCGDGIFSPQSPLREQCDAGVDAENDTRTCRASSEENHRCLTDCTLRFLPLCEPVEQAVTRLEQQEQIPLSQSPETTVCGNGILEAGEACDIGTQNSDTRPNACRTNCTVPRCGDGVIDTNELCDDGNTTSEDGCSALCLKEEEMLEAKEEVLGPEEVLGLAEEEETETETETETEVEVQVKTPGSQMQKEPTTPTLHGSPSSKAPSQAAFLGGILVIAGLVSIWRWWRMSHL